MVERFEKRERFSGTETQTSLEPCLTPVADKPDTSAVQKMERVCHSSTDGEIAIAPPPTAPPRGEPPSISVRSLDNRREISKDKSRLETTNIVTPNIVLGRDTISRPLNERFERRDSLVSKEEEKTVPTLHAVPRDKNLTALNDGFERREGLDSNDDEKTVMLPCAVPNNRPTASTGNFIREPLECKEEEKTITPPRALTRDKTPNAVGVSSERRERFNSKEEQATRVSSRVIPSREKTQIPVVGGIRRRDKLHSNEDQMVNASTRLLSSRERSRMSTTGERFERSQRCNSNDDQDSIAPLRSIFAMDRMTTSLVGLQILCIKDLSFSVLSCQSDLF